MPGKLAEHYHPDDEMPDSLWIGPVAVVQGVPTLTRPISRMRGVR
jgi:hypothetical protein